MGTIPLWITGIAAFGTAILSGLGLGSAGLFVLYLTLIAGLAQAEAQSINLLFFLFSAGASFLFHLRHRVVPVPFVAFLVCCAIPGSLAGTWLLGVLDISLIRKLFGGMLVVTARPSLLGKHRSRRGRSPSDKT